MGAAEEHDDPQGDFLAGLKYIFSIVLCGGILAAAVLTAKLAGLSLNDADDAFVTGQIVAENDCKVAKQRAGQYATALVHLLNRKTVVIGETTKVSCTVKEAH